MIGELFRKATPFDPHDIPQKESAAPSAKGNGANELAGKQLHSNYNTLARIDAIANLVGEVV